MLVPDLAGWRSERMPKMENVPFFTLAPDWVCEVISPSSARHDRVRKLPIYARERVPHLWLVDPLARTVELFRLAEPGPDGDCARYLLLGAFADDARVRGEPFEAAELAIARWWAG
ncbi:MAG: Uma2 family endonuclease [Myxococcota bacterium]